MILLEMNNSEKIVESRARVESWIPRNTAPNVNSYAMKNGKTEKAESQSSLGIC